MTRKVRSMQKEGGVDCGGAPLRREGREKETEAGDEWHRKMRDAEIRKGKVRY